MTVEIDVRLEGVDEIARRWQAAPQRFAERMRGFMSRATLLLEGEVKKNTPVNTGALRASITHQIKGVGAEMQGIVGTVKQYAPYVETGTRPHWPPPAPIRYWVMRKLRLRGPALETVTFLVQRAIARRGTRGAQMFQKAFENTRAQIAEMWTRTWTEAIDQEL